MLLNAETGELIPISSYTAPPEGKWMLDRSKWHELKMTLAGADFKAYMDGELALEYTFGSAPTAGRSGATPNDDLYPANPGNDTTIGVALRQADHLDEFRAAVAADFDTVGTKFEAVNANINGFQKQNTTRHAELEAKLDEVLTLLKQP